MDTSCDSTSDMHAIKLLQIIKVDLPETLSA